MSTPFAREAATTPTAVANFHPDGVKIGLEPVVDGLNAPLFVTHAGDGSNRLFVLEKAGTIRIVADGALFDTLFLDIRDRVNIGLLTIFDVWDGKA